MSDKTIKLRWAGQGSIVSDNITPITLGLKKALSSRPTGSISPENDNLLIEGDNAPVMKSLIAGKFQLRGKIDFMLWDPPYNTGNKGAKGFIYEDNFYLTKEQQARWSEENKTLIYDITAKNGEQLKADETKRGNDSWVKETDASKHSKWLSWMDVRLNLAKKLLRPSGVIAVHIGYQELFRLGLLMDEIFGEENRLGIINWQCTGSAKNDKKGIASSTDYILVYGKEKAKSYIADLPRTAQMESAYHQKDGDARPWRQGDLSASSGTDDYLYGIENPMTGQVFYPPEGSFWRISIHRAIKILKNWGCDYEIRDSACRTVLNSDRKKAFEIRENGPWPEIYFSNKKRSKGDTSPKEFQNGQPLQKRYRDSVRKEGITPQSFWPYDEAMQVDGDSEIGDENAVSLTHQISGTNRGGKKLVKDILGSKEVFDTVKPLRITKQLISLFCPKDGIVLDAFAGPGTTGHATLELNQEDNAKRRFILIERGGENTYADRITAERIRRVISGKWATLQSGQKPLGGSFAYYKAGNPISAKHILESKRHDLIEIIMTSHAGSTEVDPIPNGSDIIGSTASGNAIALVWNPAEGANHGVLTLERHKKIIADANSMGLKARPIYIYGTVNAGPNGSGSYYFNQIPDEILAALGVNGSGD